MQYVRILKYLCKSKVINLNYNVEDQNRDCELRIAQVSLYLRRNITGQASGNPSLPCSRPFHLDNHGSVSIFNRASFWIIGKEGISWK